MEGVSNRLLQGSAPERESQGRRYLLSGLWVYNGGMQKLTIYTKPDCHLCEEAYRLLMDVACDVPLVIDVVDISQPHHQSFWEKYCQQIPVIAKRGAETELAWPFTVDDIKAYLAR